MIRGNTTVNLPDIKRASLIADKRITTLTLTTALLICHVALVLLLLTLIGKKSKTHILLENMAHMRNVFSTSIAHNSIYAATNKGIYRANIYESNLADYRSWEKLSAHSQSHVDLLESFNGLLFVNLHGQEYNSDTLYHFDGNNWVVFEQESSNVSIKASSQQLVITPF